MDQSAGLEVIRLRAAASALTQDARLWRWFSDQMEEHRLNCERNRDFWRITVAGRELACDRSFDVAVRAAYTLSRALEAL
ncbi:MULTISPECIES: hypothetical protein [unclassified Cupriavidus]|uniref:hypothetical protein n=1 Tax=unclassified Cupriavidus TaxID=2640874 RepID=UPI0010F8E876|nr:MULTISPECIES: hypothetical protein [unclassified Cupriavidus]MWL91064.1 hypothetical protein [Cupriavidus sp. SW-Y-13]